jgi:hypothetical protein
VPGPNIGGLPGTEPSQADGISAGVGLNSALAVQLAVGRRQVRQHRVGIGDLQPDICRLIAKAWLAKERLDPTILHVHRIAPAPRTARFHNKPYKNISPSILPDTGRPRKSGTIALLLIPYPLWA